MYDYTNGMPLLHVQTEKQNVSHLFTIKMNLKNCGNLLLKDIESTFCGPIVTFLPTKQCIASFYICSHLETSYLINTVNSFNIELMNYSTVIHA